MRVQGKVCAIYTEPAYVSWQLSKSAITENAKRKIIDFCDTIKRRNDISFYTNHFVFEVADLKNRIFHVGINDGDIIIGIGVTSDYGKKLLIEPIQFPIL